MTNGAQPFSIGIPIYAGADLLDIAAPAELFNWMSHYWQQAADAPGSATVTLIAANCSTLKTRDGLTLTPDETFDDYGKGKQLDLLWVPGGSVDSLKRMMHDKTYLAFLRSQSAGARYVCSVCEGALLLASAGLLDGYLATTHWAFIPCLKSFTHVTVADGNPRFVVDRNRVTGGGISSGIDEALQLIVLIAGEAIATHVQLVTQYFPAPPVCNAIPGSTSCPLDE